MATIHAELTIKMPVMPNFVQITGMRSGDLDDALARGTEFVNIDVASLKGTTLDAFITAWGHAFREHVEARRKEQEEKLKRVQQSPLATLQR